MHKKLIDEILRIVDRNHIKLQETSTQSRKGLPWLFKASKKLLLFFQSNIVNILDHYVYNLRF